jgi:hypothetical protein
MFGGGRCSVKLEVLLKLLPYLAECTHSGGDDAITIWELVAPAGTANQCRWAWGNPTDPPRLPSQNCTSLAYGKDCSRITGQVNLLFALLESWANSFENSRMGESLQKLGIGNGTEIAGSLLVTNLGVNTNANLAMNFFTRLQRVNALQILGSSLRTPRPIPMGFGGFPGVQNIEQTKRLVLNRTSMLTVQDFSGLRCVGSMQITETNVNDLSGIQDVRVDINELREGDKENLVEIIGNSNLGSTTQLKPLFKLAGCQGGPVPDASFCMDRACPTPIEGWGALCSIIQINNCDARPPSPPRPLQPPPDPAFPPSIFPPPGTA